MMAARDGGDWERPDAGVGEDFEREKKGRPPAVTGAAILSTRRFVETASGVFYEYDAKRGHWIERTRETMLSIVHRASPKANNAYRSEVVKWIGAETHDADLEWGRVGPSEIAVRNGVIDLATMKIREHSADDWLDYVVPHNWNPAAECPVWTKALDDWLGIESVSVAAIQEFAGYLLMPHARHKKALVPYGESDTGKTRIPMTFKALVGSAATCSIGIEHMDDPVSMAAIKHKRLNMLTELSADSMIKDGGFKTLVSTEEPVFINPKYQRPEMYVPVAKHVIACNTLPDVTDRTSATFNRLLIVPFTNIIPEERQDPDLDDKIAAEMPGVLAWAVVGAGRLWEQGGRFTDIPEAVAIIAEYRAESNPMNDFVANEMVPAVDGAVPLIDIVKLFNEKKYGRQIDSRRAGKMLRSAFGQDSTHPHRIHSGLAPVRCFMGHRFKHPSTEGSTPYEPLGGSEDD